MIEAVYRIGKILPQSDFLEEFIDDVGDNYKNVFKVAIDISNPEKPEYLQIDFEEYDSSKKLKYFYKRAPSGNGSDKTPTSKTTTIEKHLKTRLKMCLVNFLKRIKNSSQIIRKT